MRLEAIAVIAVARRAGRPILRRPRFQICRRRAKWQQVAARAKKRNRVITAVAAGVVLLMIGIGVVLQVRSTGNESTTAASAADVTVREYPAINHLLMAGEGQPRPAEYAVPAHVAAEVVADLASWVEGSVP